MFSREIWLGDNSGESLGFARNVEVVGWTNVGDKRNGAYVGKPIILKLLRFSNLNFVLIYVVIVYDCAIRTKEVRAAH